MSRGGNAVQVLDHLSDQPELGEAQAGSGFSGQKYWKAQGDLNTSLPV